MVGIASAAVLRGLSPLDELRVSLDATKTAPAEAQSHAPDPMADVA